MLLSHLNKRILMPDMAIKPLAQKLANRGVDVAANNLEIARKLDCAKLHLINNLAQFSMSVWWLINKYEARVYAYAEQDSEISLTTKRADCLKNLKKHDLITKQALEENKSLAEDSDEKRHFIETFCAFPFSFEDLIELTDLIVYVFQRRNIATNIQQKKSPDWVIRRLSRLTRLHESTLAKLSDTVLASNPSLHSLSDDRLYQSVMDSIVAEHHWLMLRQKMVENNVRLVVFIANQYKGSFLEFDDLVQEGQTGLLTAADKFDCQFGCQFSTYAAYWIRQRILRALSRSERVIRVPCEQIGNINRLFRAKDEWLAKTGKEATVEELADNLSLSLDEINAILSMAQTTLPLENFDSEDEMLAPIDVIEQQVFEPSFNQMAQTELADWLERAVKTLDEREAKVICCHFGLHIDHEMTLQEIGTELKISRERVRQIQAMAFNKIKLNYSEQLISFLS